MAILSCSAQTSIHQLAPFDKLPKPKLSKIIINLTLTPRSPSRKRDIQHLITEFADKIDYIQVANASIGKSISNTFKIVQKTHKLSWRFINIELKFESHKGAPVLSRSFKEIVGNFARNLGIYENCPISVSTQFTPFSGFHLVGDHDRLIYNFPRPRNFDWCLPRNLESAEIPNPIATLCSLREPHQSSISKTLFIADPVSDDTHETYANSQVSGNLQLGLHGLRESVQKQATNLEGFNDVLPLQIKTDENSLETTTVGASHVLVNPESSHSKMVEDWVEEVGLDRQDMEVRNNSYPYPLQDANSGSIFEWPWIQSQLHGTFQHISLGKSYSQNSPINASPEADIGKSSSVIQALPPPDESEGGSQTITEISASSYLESHNSGTREVGQSHLRSKSLISSYIFEDVVEATIGHSHYFNQDNTHTQLRGGYASWRYLLKSAVKKGGAVKKRNKSSYRPCLDNESEDIDLGYGGSHIFAEPFPLYDSNVDLMYIYENDSNSCRVAGYNSPKTEKNPREAMNVILRECLDCLHMTEPGGSYSISAQRGGAGIEKKYDRMIQKCKEVCGQFKSKIREATLSVNGRDNDETSKLVSYENFRLARRKEGLRTIMKVPEGDEKKKILENLLNEYDQLLQRTEDLQRYVNLLEDEDACGEPFNKNSRNFSVRLRVRLRGGIGDGLKSKIKKKSFPFLPRVFERGERSNDGGGSNNEELAENEEFPGDEGLPDSVEPSETAALHVNKEFPDNRGRSRNEELLDNKKNSGMKMEPGIERDEDGDEHVAHEDGGETAVASTSASAGKSPYKSERELHQQHNRGDSGVSGVVEASIQPTNIHMQGNLPQFEDVASLPQDQARRLEGNTATVKVEEVQSSDEDSADGDDTSTGHMEYVEHIENPQALFEQTPQPQTYFQFRELNEDIELDHVEYAPNESSSNGVTSNPIQQRQSRFLEDQGESSRNASEGEVYFLKQKSSSLRYQNHLRNHEIPGKKYRIESLFEPLEHLIIPEQGEEEEFAEEELPDLDGEVARLPNSCESIDHLVDLGCTHAWAAFALWTTEGNVHIAAQLLTPLLLEEDEECQLEDDIDLMMELGVASRIEAGNMLAVDDVDIEGAILALECRSPWDAAVDGEDPLMAGPVNHRRTVLIKERGEDFKHYDRTDVLDEWAGLEH